jgi:hypothetical protein
MMQLWTPSPLQRFALAALAEHNITRTSLPHLVLLYTHIGRDLYRKKHIGRDEIGFAFSYNPTLVFFVRNKFIWEEDLSGYHVASTRSYLPTFHSTVHSLFALVHHDR